MSKYKRSPFLLTYWDEDNKNVLYNYDRNTKARISYDLMKILDMLSSWRNVHQIADALCINEKDLTKALEHLVRLEIIQRKDPGQTYSDIPQKSLWDPIDLAMQRQRSFGGRFPMSKRLGNSPTPIKRVNGLESILLPPPRSNLEKSGSLLDILDERKSIRRYADNYITMNQLSDFLYHSSRIKKIFKSKEGILTKRPYASGGARYPLEIYVSNNRISGIQKGIHYYDPLKHRLVLVNKNKNYQKKFNTFLLDVQYPLMDREPDVVFIITAVFARTMWKYDKLGMSLILSDLGCLYQTMYLLATEMKLAPCPIGKTEEELVKNWLNLNWFEESHVGTFMLGVPESD
jgi:SagB-type dehydrogenase family enzyme